MSERHLADNPPVMVCGHAANATDAEGHPVCVICVGIKPGATIIATAPSLEGRVARCTYKHTRGGLPHPDRTVPSSTNLAFFSHHPAEAEDEYYCGCWGWD